MSRKRHWVAIYTRACALLQIALYVAVSAGVEVPVTLDPRFGLFIVETLFDPRASEAPGVARWAAAVALEAAAWLLFRGGSPVPYLAIEALCSAPFVLFAAAVLWANASPAHGFSVPELLWPLIVFVGFSVVPARAAWRLARREYGAGID